MFNQERIWLNVCFAHMLIHDRFVRMLIHLRKIFHSKVSLKCRCQCALYLFGKNFEHSCDQVIFRTTPYPSVLCKRWI